MKKIIAISLVLLPTLGFTQGDIESSAGAIKALEKQAAENNYSALTDLLNETKDTINANNSSQNRYAKINTNASKIEDIKGTWIISYIIDTINYTDKLVINQTTTLNGDISGVGTVQEDVVGVNLATVCSYDPSKLVATGGDYICVNKNQTYTHNYSFTLTGNTLSGFYGLGKSDAEATTSLLKKSVPITAYREAAAEADLYDIPTGKVYLRDVVLGNDRYSAILQDTGNFNFVLLSAAKK